MKHIVLVPFVALALSGCAVTAMDAKIAPAPQITSSNIGGGREVGVMVTDERPRKDLGRRAAGGGAIRLNYDLASTYQAALIKGLIAKGFAAVPGSSAQSNLRVEIRGLTNDPSVGLWTVGADIDSTIKAFATNSAMQPYDNVYRYASSNRTMFVSDAVALNAKLNMAVNDTLTAFFNDQKMLETLAAR